MDECMTELVIKRCEHATTASNELKNLDKEEGKELEARALAEELCYRQGFKDALKFFNDIK